MSKHHCKIEYVGELKCNLVDLESVNGTFVNGIRVNGSCFLEPFDTVTVGNVNVPWMHYFSSADDGMQTTGLIEPPI